jgi:hypothetical protein
MLTLYTIECVTNHAPVAEQASQREFFLIAATAT